MSTAYSKGDDFFRQNWQFWSFFVLIYFNQNEYCVIWLLLQVMWNIS